jgi:hypothetical protein
MAFFKEKCHKNHDKWAPYAVCKAIFEGFMREAQQTARGQEKFWNHIATE